MQTIDSALLSNTRIRLFLYQLHFDIIYIGLRIAVVRLAGLEIGRKPGLHKNASYRAVYTVNLYLT